MTCFTQTGLFFNLTITSHRSRGGKVPRLVLQKKCRRQNFLKFQLQCQIIATTEVLKDVTILQNAGASGRADSSRGACGGSRHRGHHLLLLLARR